jgi:hypothetical protein
MHVPHVRARGQLARGRALFRVRPGGVLELRFRFEHFILDGHDPVPADLLTWGAWFQTADRHVARDGDEGSGWWISTVFLGVDHGFGVSGPPLLFETMIFAPAEPRQSAAFVAHWDQQCQRYATWAEAAAGHAAIVAEFRTALAIVEAE